MILFTPAFLPRRLFAAVMVLLALALFSASKVQAQTWLVSTDAFVKMGVVDKFGQLGAYTAKFVVTNQRNGKEYILIKEVARGQNGVDVLFPSPPTEADYFKANSGEAGTSAPGSYAWECLVAGKKVVGGRFSFSEVANDVNLVSKQ